MRKTFLIALCFFVLQTGFTQRLQLLYVSVQPHTLNYLSLSSPIVPAETTTKKVSLKERLLLKWYKKKIHTRTDEEKEKKSIRLLSLISALASLLGPFVVLLAFTSATPGIFVTAGILFSIAAIILGIVALKKIKNLHNKNGTNKALALAGIIVASLFILAFLSLFATVNW